MNPWHHAESSARLHGGTPEDYWPVHDWFDQTKAHFPDFRHRAARHHSEGIFLCERIFGPAIVRKDGKTVPTRIIGEQHVKEDCGRIPTLADWLSRIQPEPWMLKVGKLEGDSIQSMGGKARAEALTPEERSDIASRAANARWNPHTYEI